MFELPEVIFDLDHPGHYLRRIKSVSLTIPAVAGPHTSVGARLVLERHRMRLAPTIGAGYAEVEDDARFETGVDRFPAALRRVTLTVRGVEVIPVPAFGTAPFGAERMVRVGPDAEAMQSVVLDQGDAPHGALGLEHAVTDHPWLLDLSGLEVISTEDVADLVILVRFGLS